MRIFAVSDVHGHAGLLCRALTAAGFEVGNEEHLLVCCGDCFDRGVENVAVMELLESVPNKVLVKGNHEDMLERALLRRRLTATDVYNGTDVTVESFFGAESIDRSGVLLLDEKVKKRLLDFTGGMTDFLETDNYVFVHGWVPLRYTDEGLSAREDWRCATSEEWAQARFLEWHKLYGRGLGVSGKTVVCGHRTTALAQRFDPTRQDGDTQPFRGDGVIAIDSGTVRSGKLHVLVVEDTLL
jgi:serine/threonine protein phosphatase 1